LVAFIDTDIEHENPSSLLTVTEPHKEVCALEFVNTYQQLSAMHLPISVKEANPFTDDIRILLKPKLSQQHPVSLLLHGLPMKSEVVTEVLDTDERQWIHLAVEQCQ